MLTELVICRRFAILWCAGIAWLTLSAMASGQEVTPPPPELNLDPFYQKYVSASGYPVVSSAKVNDYALKEAAYLIDMMLAKRPDVRQAMIDGGSRVVVMAHDEFTTDLPEQRQMKPKDFWDARARGLGGSQTDPLCSCAEENLLGFEGDPYTTENILIHEFAHNHVNTRGELVEYDPGLAAICEEVFGDTELVYTKPATRLDGHMAGYDPSKAPTFHWPERLHEVQRKIREEAQQRGREKKAYTK